MFYFAEQSKHVCILMLIYNTILDPIIEILSKPYIKLLKILYHKMVIKVPDEESFLWAPHAVVNIYK